ncbi:MAG: tetratricopeptide repeat protein [Bacteroidia bacterium]
MTAKRSNKPAADLKEETPRNGIFFIVAAVFILFAKTLTCKFVALDDFAYIAENPFIKDLSFKGIAAIFSSFYNFNYHPFTTLLYTFEFKFFGLNATGYHFVSILLHVANTYLVFWLIVKLTKRKETPLICALLFGIHPMHVESAAWISEQKDLLYTLFYLLSLGFYIDNLHSFTKKGYAVTLVFFIASLLSKPAAITLPIVLFVIDMYLGKTFDLRSIVKKIPFLIFSALFACLTISSQNTGALDSELMPSYSLVQRFFVLSYTFCFYIIKLIYPANLSALHYAPRQIPCLFYIMPLIVFAIAFLIYKTKQLKKELIFGIAFYFFSICLTLQIIPVGYSIVSERYSYVPYIGLFFIVGTVYVGIIDNKISGLIFLKPLLKYISVGIAVIFITLSWKRIDKWKDSIALFKDLADKYPTSYHAQFSLGKSMADAGDTTNAMIYFNKSIQLDPTVADPYFFRGNMFYGRKDFTNAIADFKNAVAINPKYNQALYNLGICYNNTGNFTEAENALTKALAIQANEFTYQARANTYFYSKQYEKAIGDYTNVLKINGAMAEAYHDRGVCYLYLQQNQKACEDWKKSLEMGYSKANEVISQYCK